MSRLADETSPYLRQHASNPVDWYPWGDEAFTAARRLDRPVLVSIGYSACHWCHVMAHESFEDPGTASLLNERFVSVKVDREERPDVDAVYMEAVQAVTGRGGWPMTVFVLPDGRPFYAGTYFPDQPRSGMPSFTDVLEAVDQAWHQGRDELVEQADRLSQAVEARSRLPGGGTPGAAAMPPGQVLADAFAAARALHDDRLGGFGVAPKFPQPSLIELVAAAHQRSGGTESLAMLTTTLDAMASGGIYDHLAGGFARYSVDAHWLVPHFEKMLYDQAGLALAYLHGWQLTGEQRWLQVTEETLRYVLSDLRAPSGGFYSAEDADSEGEEGRFYLWTKAQLREALGSELPERSELPELAAEWYGVTEEGNFEGSNILHRPRRGDLIRPPEVERARQILLARRAERVRPGLDDKVLTEWNAMMVAALAEAGSAAGRPDWLEAAVECADFLLSNLRRSDGRWLRSWQGGRARHLAYAGDHAWLIEAFTRLAEATGRSRWIDEASAVADAMLERYWDVEEGGLFTTGQDAERLIVRSKDSFDEAIPSANGAGAVALARLGALTGVARYGEAAEAVLAMLGETLARRPSAFAHALRAVDMVVNGVTEIAVVGERPDLVRAVQRRWLPSAVLAWGQPYDSPLWADRSPGWAYVCRGYACEAPVAEVDALDAALAAARPGAQPEGPATGGDREAG